MFQRSCNPLITRSFFIFGARGTGKTYLLREMFSQQDVLWLNLLSDETALPLMREPSRLEKLIESKLINRKDPLWVVIDEVQKVTSLLDEVHRLLEEPSYRERLKFALTGSSARKLKRGGANLLGGRALLNYLYPLTHRELGDSFSLEEVLTWGTLPAVVTAKSALEKSELLRAYVSTYLKEEIKEEQLIRKLDPFVRFLEVAAQMNGELINFARIGRDCLVDEKQVLRYYQILEDTLLGFFLEPFHESVRKRQSQQPKFYLFDIGVYRSLAGLLTTSVIPGSSDYGDAFEHFIILECVRLNHYLRKDYRFSFFRTADGYEIDLVVDRPAKKRALIEIKSTTRPDKVEVKKLGDVGADFPNSETFIFCQTKEPMLENNVRILHWKEGLKLLFN